MESLIPEVPSSPVYKDDSDLESSSKARQESPKGENLKNDTRIRLEDDSYKRVKHHLAPLTKIQSTVIGLTNEIKKLGSDLAEGRIPTHLLVPRSLPKLPGCLACSEELRDSWSSFLQRTGRFKEEERARIELDTLPDNADSKRLLWTLLEKSAKKTESQFKYRPQKAERRRHRPIRTPDY
ncbi:hypothetical protein HOLleu_01497 [Holothuria leucospilota]|uniref:Uncharacterized protein n=1 Tax=Holothuria leucospilota TaxID=206669 RepID=A0A9Q1CQX2_HOLLE|nr:hypothetical protein HOLleu_01497 [Holothuria leucospilota]